MRNSIGPDHRLQWQPPTRPDWLIRLNEEGHCMDIKGVIPLEEHGLIDSAMKNTGLSDFGADDWREPFRIYINALNEEADLNLMGRIRARWQILGFLEARLQIEDTYKRHPEITDQEIKQPIIIVGQGRSGTSFLQNLLAADPDNGVLRHWEMMLPCPPPETTTYHSDSRIEKADKLIDQLNRVVPSLASMHELRGHMPFEDSVIMAINFMAPTWMDTIGQVPSFDAWIFQQDPAPAFRYHQRVLKLLQWKNPRKRWVLKDPMHLDRMADILKIYPDACFIWPHRDPVRALASLVSIIGTLQWSGSDHPFKGGSLAYMTDPEVSAARFNAVLDQLEAGVVPQRQICNLLYRDFVTDPMAAVSTIYRKFGLEMSQTSYNTMAKYLDDNPRDLRPAHRFNAGSPKVISRARNAYRRYQDYFAIPQE
jgi:Sulfotransferase family